MEYIVNMKNTTADYIQSLLRPLVPTGSPIISISCINDRAYYFFSEGLLIPSDFHRFAYFDKAFLVKQYQLESFVEALENLSTNR